MILLGEPEAELTAKDNFASFSQEDCGEGMNTTNKSRSKSKRSPQSLELLVLAKEEQTK